MGGGRTSRRDCESRRIGLVSEVTRLVSLVFVAVLAGSACGSGASLDTDTTGYGETAQSHRMEAVLPSSGEIEIAVADATCRDTSGYRTIYAERRSIYENQVLAGAEQMLPELDDIRPKQKETLSDLITAYGLYDEDCFDG